jgi:hypothetical protein
MADEKMSLGPEVWRRVFSSPLYQQVGSLFKQIFKRGFAFYDLEGISCQEFEKIRGS